MFHFFSALCSSCEWRTTEKISFFSLLSLLWTAKEENAKFKGVPEELVPVQPLRYIWIYIFLILFFPIRFQSLLTLCSFMLLTDIVMCFNFALNTLELGWISLCIGWCSFQLCCAGFNFPSIIYLCSVLDVGKVSK